jgi:hypothetical protein
VLLTCTRARAHLGITKYPNTAMSVAIAAMQPPSVPLPNLNVSLSLAFMILVNPPVQVSGFVC